MVKKEDMNTLQKKGVRELERQLRNGMSMKTSDVKSDIRNGGDPNQKYSVISSGKRLDNGTYTGSLKNHVSAWTKVAGRIAEFHPKVKRLTQVTPDMVKEVIEFERTHGGIDGTGAAEKTLKGYVTAVNHVMVGSDGHFWKSSDLLALSEIYGRRDVRFYGRREPHGKAAGSVYKQLNASEWRDRHSDLYLKNKDLIDTSRAFGLREREIFGSRGLGEFPLTDRSFVINNGKIGVETIGKGGKYRVAWARADMNAQMVERYGQFAREWRGDLTAAQREQGLPALTHDANKLFRRGHEHVPLHIFRVEYAQQLLRERLAVWEARYEAKTVKGLVGAHNGEVIGYSRLSGQKMKEVLGQGYMTKIDGYFGHVEAFREVSLSLGHNRLDVLPRYLRQ